MNCEEGEFVSYIPKKKLLAPSDKHIPNKNEGKLLRKLMQKSGKTEEELCADKSMRQKLAAARSKHGTGANARKLLKRQIKTACARELGLPFYDPAVIQLAEDRIKNRHRTWCSGYQLY